MWERNGQSAGQASDEYNMRFALIQNFVLLLLCLVSSVILTVSEKILATVPNLQVINDVLFMEIVQPVSISYTYKIRPARNFGTNFCVKKDYALDGYRCVSKSRKYSNIELAIAEPYHGCSPFMNAHFLAGKIVLVQRGECSFVTKSVHAENAGVIAVVIADNDIQNDQAFVDMVDDNTERVVNIPATFLLGKDGHMIKETLNRLGMSSAIINIPLNITGAAIHQITQPPWTLW